MKETEFKYLKIYIGDATHTEVFREIAYQLKRQNDLFEYNLKKVRTT